MIADQCEREDFDPTSNAWYTPIDPTALSQAPPRRSDVVSRMDQIHQLSLLLVEQEDWKNSDGPVQKPFEPKNRQFSRCPIVEDRTTGTLTVNGRTFDCRLVEMSIGGFGVVVSGKPAITTGAEGHLRAPGLNYVVSVTRLEGRPGSVYVGLKKLEEIAEPPLSFRRHHSAAWGYIVAAFSGAMIALFSYYIMTGK